MVEMCFPWPPAALSPNARSRTHWKRTAAIKKYRAACGWSAAAQGVRQIKADRLDVRITFLPPRRGINDDNMIAAFKPGRDGIADAIGIPDERWTVTYAPIGEPVPGGLVVVEIALP